jgi:hypothetical protein
MKDLQMTKREAYTRKETDERFNAILRGAMHKPTPHKDVPKKRGGSRSATKARKPK